jgi:adenylate kinase family enzyme
MIFWRPGSGKSEFSQKLHQFFPGYPLYHLDKYFYIDNWQERPADDFLRIQQQFIDQPQWIIDGNSIRSLEMRYAQADFIIYFLLPRWLCF